MISALGTKKDQWLESWGYSPGNDAEQAWEAKKQLDAIIASRSGEIKGNAGIIPDIQPYKSMIDGTMITSRSKHRTHLKDNGCIEIGNEKVTPKPITPPKGLSEDLKRAAYQHGLLRS